MIMSHIRLEIVDKDSFIPGLKIFNKAMGFDPETEDKVIAYTKLFYDSESFIGITAIEPASSSIVGLALLFSYKRQLGFPV